MANVTYYLIREKRLGKKTNDGYFLYDGRGWIPDERNVIRDHLMGYDPNDDTPYGFGSLSIMDEIEEITEERAIRTMNQQTIDNLIAKWKKDFVKDKEEWDKNPGWPAKLVETEFTLNGITYALEPNDLGLTDDCWDQGFMETIQGRMTKDLEACGAVNIYNHGFID